MLSSRAACAALLTICGFVATGCTSKCCFLRGGSDCGACVDECGDCVDGCGDICKPKSMAFQRWKGCGFDWPKLCPCTGPECGPCCGCPSCGCEEPECCCEEHCGCGDACEKKKLGCCLGNLLSRFKKKDKGCGDCCDACDEGCGPCGSGGCDREVYWSEWHCDPPRCCDPCDKCGNWVGPAAGPYRAPYDHAYMPY